MKYQIGDKILLLHSDEEGEVLDIINDKMVMVNINGVEIPGYTPTRSIFLILKDSQRRLRRLKNQSNLSIP